MENTRKTNQKLHLRTYIKKDILQSTNFAIINMDSFEWMNVAYQ